MELAILSDTHDNIWKLDEALPHLREADAVIHCGDLCAPFVVGRLGEGVPDVPIHIVWGNNDGDPFRISNVAQSFSQISLHGEHANIELDGQRIGVNHFPGIARGLALSGQYDFVFYGHDHTANEEKIGDCLLLNPGELMGMNGRSTLALVSTETRKVRWIEL